MALYGLRRFGETLAARRLIAVLLVLLFLSSLAAALAPVEGPDSTESSTSTSTTATATDGDTGPGTLIRQSIDASVGEPVTIRAETGDQLQLRVTSTNAGTIELEGLGDTEDVGPDAPALFDVLLEDEDDFAVRFLGGREIATIRVADAEE